MDLDLSPLLMVFPAHALVHYLMIAVNRVKLVRL